MKGDGRWESPRPDGLERHNRSLERSGGIVSGGRCLRVCQPGRSTGSRSAAKASRPARGLRRNTDPRPKGKIVHDETIDSRSPLERLIRAVGRGHYSEESKAYRACYDIGPPLVPQIVEKINAVSWKGLGSSGRVAYFTFLMSLLHDIDESASRKLADAVLRRGCHPVIATRLRSIQAFTLSDFEAIQARPPKASVLRGKITR